MKRKIIYLSIIVIVIISSIIAYNQYRKFFVPNISSLPEDGIFLHIATNSDYSDLLDTLKHSNILIDYKSFKRTAALKNLRGHIYPGRYLLKNKMNNNEIVNMFRSGSQSLVKLSINNIRTLEQLAGKISKQIEPDSISLLSSFKDGVFLNENNIKQDELLSVFIPNTYEFYWNTSPKKFLSRMINENRKFWNQSRLDKANKIEMTPIEISTLASIIDEETTKLSEKPRIAGVYINRLKRGIALRADPTVKFALQDFFRKRITDKDLEIDSPYNTYKYNGLPPGPIRIASIATIDAVLDYEKHSYFYFCAKEDFSGYHVFAKTLFQHNQNARRYHKALNKRRIYR